MEAAISGYQASISLRTPGMDKICGEYWKAELKYIEERERRAFEEKRLLERSLYVFRIKKSYRSSSNWNYKWSGGLFGLLENRARILAERWKNTSTVSPRLTDAIVEALRDCELVVRYFEESLSSIQANNSEHTREGVVVSRHLRSIFPRQRDLISFYEFRVLRLDDVGLQDIELDGERGRRLRKAAAHDAEAIRRRWQDYRDPIGVQLEAELSKKSSSVDSDANTACNISGQMWLGHLFRSYTWKLLRQSRARVQALCIACEEGDVKEANLLLHRGTFVNGVGEANATPLICAVRQRQVDIVRLLLHNRADPNLNCGMTPLLEAVEAKSLDIAKMLVHGGAKVNTRNWPDESRRGVTALYRAADLGLVDIVYFLLNQGADCTLTYCDHVADNHQISALHVAKGQCAKHIYNITEREGDYFRASAKDRRGRIPLFWAMERQDWHAIPYCKPHWRTEKDAVDVDGNNVVHEFCKILSHTTVDEQAKHAVQQILHMATGSIRSPNSEGRTPLQMLAAMAAHRPRPEDAENDVFEYCKKLILEADLDYINRTANPDDYWQNPVIYCFGTGPKPTTEEIYQNMRQSRQREEREAQARVAQAALFESMMAEYRSDTPGEMPKPAS